MRSRLPSLVSIQIKRLLLIPSVSLKTADFYICSECNAGYLPGGQKSPNQPVSAIASHAHWVWQTGTTFTSAKILSYFCNLHCGCNVSPHQPLLSVALTSYQASTLRVQLLSMLLVFFLRVFQLFSWLMKVDHFKNSFTPRKNFNQNEMYSIKTLWTKGRFKYDRTSSVQSWFWIYALQWATKYYIKTNR